MVCLDVVVVGRQLGDTAADDVPSRYGGACEIAAAADGEFGILYEQGEVVARLDGGGSYEVGENLLESGVESGDILGGQRTLLIARLDLRLQAVERCGE